MTQPTRANDEGEADDGAAFGGARTEFSVPPGPAEGWDRDAQDEDALMAHGQETPGDVDADATTDVPPVAAATPHGDVAGVGDPRAVEAVDAVAVDRDEGGDDVQGLGRA